MQSYKIKPPTYLLVAIILIVVLHFNLPVIVLIPAPWTLFGILPLVLGIVISVQADQLFHEVDTPVSPFDNSSVLVICGPYRYTRNPMYLGFTLILLGVSILAGSLMPFVVVLAFALLMDRLFIQMEERKLAATFGVQWEAYKRQTRRWL